ncbi:MAG: TetR/AcrR family transcriptional regulator [Pseudomonadota bacterium]
MKSKTQKSAETGATAPVDVGGRLWSGRRTPKDSRRDQILRSVGDVLSDSRLSSLSMVDIADRLGITKGNLYYYFNDKQDILYQCHMRSMGISLDALASLDAGDSPDLRLRQLLERHIMGIIDGGMGGVLLTDLESLSEQQRSTYVARRDEFESGVRRLIEAGVAEGVLACADAKLASLTILGAINWIPKWYRSGGPLSSEEIAEGMADLLLRSVQPAPARSRAPPVVKPAAARAPARKTVKPAAK